MSNDCKYIDDFYQALKATENYELVISQKTIGLFGTKSNYILPTLGGFVKVKCDSGLSTANFANVEISFSGSIKGNHDDILLSKSSSFFAKSIKPIDPNGFLELTTLTSTVALQLPYPSLKNK